MKKIIWSTLYLSLVMLFMYGCANWGGSNPVGVTGGSEQGYGKSRDLNLPLPESGSSSELIGTWRHDYSSGTYEIVEFKSNGKYSIRYYENSSLQFGLNGDYSVSGNTITIWIEGTPSTLNFTISGNHLTLYLGGESVTYYRVS